MKGLLRLTILEAAIAIALLRLLSEPLQAMAQVVREQPSTKLLAAFQDQGTGSPQTGGPGAIRYVPPVGDPPKSGGVGTIQGHCISTAGKPGLRALVPGSDIKNSLGDSVKILWGHTVADHPTLWFDVPYSSDDDLPMEFVLQDSKGHDLYRTNVALPKMPGVISIQVPAALQLQQRYLWTLQVKCKAANNNDNAKNDVVQGWIQRTTLDDPALIQQIKEAEAHKDVHKQAMLYAEHGIWFDALTVLGNALKTQSKDTASLNDDWKALLKSAGLQESASSPIVKR